MRRMLPLLPIVAALTLSFVPTGSASALGSEQLGCRFSPSPAGTPITVGACNPTTLSTSYAVGWQVLDESGSGYSFAWTIPTDHRYPVNSGCTSTTDYCNITVNGRIDEEVTVSVVVTQNGSSETLSATATSSAVCGDELC
jgi:hypothetical protein